MWADRDMDEHSVFDHKPRENGINHHPQYHHHHVPMTGGDNRIYSGLPIGGNGAPGGRIISPVHNGHNGINESHYSSLPPIDDDDDDLDDDGGGSDDTRGLSHQATLPMDQHHMQGNSSIGSQGHLLVGICGSPMEDQLGRHRMDDSSSPPDDYMFKKMGNNGSSSYGENEASMMMMMHPSPSTSEFPMQDDRDFRRDDVKLPTAVKRKDNVLKVYARKFGLNDRGCYVACVLGGLAFFFLIIIVAMTATWPASKLRHNGPLHFCTTPPCLEAAADILGSQNSSYNPCSDFWNYACRGWLTRQPIPATRSRWSTIEEMDFKLRVDKSRLIAMSSHEPSQFNSNEWKVDNFYQACMELGFVESDREKPLVKIINNLGGWEVLRSFNLYSWDSHRVLKRLHAEYYVNAFFRVEVVPDVREPTRNIIRIGPDGLGMPHKSFYHRLPTDPAVQAYQTFLKDSAQLFGAASPDAHKFSIDMFNFEKRISEITPEGSYLSDPIKINNRMMVKDLHTMSMNIPWLDILKAAYNDAQMTEETEIVVVSPQYVADIAVIMSTTDRGSLNNYLMWQLAKSYMPYLSKPFQEAADLYRKSLTSAQKPLERWEFCEVTAERFFGHLMTSMYTKSRQFDQGGQTERQRVVKKIFDYLKHNVAKSVSVSSRYDFATRRAAITKLKNMTVQIGTPDFLMNRDYLKFMYKDLLVQKTDFFQNILYGVLFLRKREEYMLVSPSEETRWLESLHLQEVSYITAANKIIVPELFLSPPLFHAGYPNSVNMGGLGVRMAQAMLEGVLGRGLLFDSSGRLVIQTEGGISNMSITSTATAAVAATSSRYESSYNDPRSILEVDAQCIVDKYTRVGVDTLGQLQKCRLDSAINVAALKEALLTLEDILELEKGILLPAMETFDPQSVFFLSYAQSLCAHETDFQRDIDRTSGSSLLNRIKLEGALSQLPEFYHFYFCSYDSSLNCGKIV